MVLDYKTIKRVGIGNFYAVCFW